MPQQRWHGVAIESDNSEGEDNLAASVISPVVLVMVDRDRPQRVLTFVDDTYSRLHPIQFDAFVNQVHAV